LADGKPIEGLSDAGNSSASIMGKSHPGAADPMQSDRKPL
jgi:hypothetical protein